MRCLWLERQQLNYTDNASIPIPGKGEALIRVILAGVCSTDLELLHGYYPFTGIPGHEFVGEVIASNGDSDWTGRRVVGEINIACRQCGMCLSGLPRHCLNRKTLGIHDWNGAFAEFVVLPVENLHQVPDSVPDVIAVFTEPLAAADEILEQVEISTDDRVLLIGAGRLGQLVAAVLRLTGCDLNVVVRHPKQSELLKSQGINCIVEKDLNSRKYDLVVEATGSADGFTIATRHIRPRGKIVLKSTFKGSLDANLSEIVVNEINLIGSRCGPFEPALKLLAEGKIDPRPMIEAVYPLEQGLPAIEHAGTTGVFKVLLQP